MSSAGDREAHLALRDALDAQLVNGDFFVWLTARVVGAPGVLSPGSRQEVVRLADEWLAGLDPDAPDAARAEMRWQHDGVSVRLQAVPKRPEARGVRRDRVVGNPEPAFAYWQNG